MNSFIAQAFDVVDCHNTAYYMIGIDYPFVSLLTSTGFSTDIQNYIIYLN